MAQWGWQQNFSTGVNNTSISKNAVPGQLERMHSAVQHYNMWPAKVKISYLVH
jgi:hypothetical protein